MKKSTKSKNISLNESFNFNYNTEENLDLPYSTLTHIKNETSKINILNRSTTNIINKVAEKKDSDSQDYPIVRCEKCFEILSIDIDLERKEFILKCEKENIVQKIFFNNFFENINKYDEFTCCEKCSKKNISKSYYLCINCQKAILCKACAKKHTNTKHKLKKIKLDSTCIEHEHPYESYCPICKENLCSYCSVDHDELHVGEKEYSLKKIILFKKEQIDEFRKRIENARKIKQNLNEKIESVISELNKKIKLLTKLKERFSKYLYMKLKIMELVLNNYEKKMKDLDMNYFIINNLKKQMNFNLEEFKFGEKDTIKNKIEAINNYILKNIKSNFKCVGVKNNKIVEKKNIINDIHFKLERFINKNSTYDAYGLNNKNVIYDVFDCNKELLGICDIHCIHFMSKVDCKIKFLYKDKDDIMFCKAKKDEDKILINFRNTLYHKILRIVDNKDCLVEDIFSHFGNINLCHKIYVNSNLDLIIDILPNYIYFICYPEYKLTMKSPKKCELFFDLNGGNYNEYDKCSYICGNYNFRDDSNVQFINNKLFFYITISFLWLFSIENDDFILQKSRPIKILKQNVGSCSIVEFNDFYCYNDNSQILLLNKDNLVLAKTIINDFLSSTMKFIKISDKISSVCNFYDYNKQLIFMNYNISCKGIKWKNISEEKYPVNMNPDRLKIINLNDCVAVFSDSNELLIFSIIPKISN